jgi:bifunctional pyridoxal-dependent enzyme with beta-cystathionase and maltose regulon repressor activities
MYSPSVIYSISKLIQLVSKEHEGVVVQTPAYDAFFKVIEGNNRQVVENPLCYQENRYTIDFQNLEEKLAKKTIQFYYYARHTILLDGCGPRKSLEKLSHYVNSIRFF